MLVSRDICLRHAHTLPTWFELAAAYMGWLVASNLHSEVLSVGQCHGQGFLLPVGPRFHFLQCHNCLVSSRNGHVCLYHSVSRGGSWYSKWEGSLNHLQAGHWLRVDHHIMSYWLYVPIIVQSDGCSLSSKDGAVTLESFGQLEASCLTILEMAVDDHHCPESLLYLGSICIDFIVSSLSVMILFEFDLGFLSGNHTFAHSFNEVVFHWVILAYTWWEAGFQISIALCRGFSCLYPETNRACWRLGHASIPIWPENI